MTSTTQRKFKKMMDLMEEPMMEGSDDDLELDMGSGEHVR